MAKNADLPSQGSAVNGDLLVLARRIASSLREETSTPTLRLKLCNQLLTGQIKEERLRLLSEQIFALNIDEQHYWVGTFYALLLSAAKRREQATYFTPPHLAQSVVSLLLKEGFDLLKHSAIDPAAGGAAFLSTLAAAMRLKGATSESIAERLQGIEIDVGLARLSETLISDRIGGSIESGAVVSVGNSLTRRTLGSFDLVLANPPYGRLSQNEISGKAWKKVCHPGHINKYALFTELCFRLVKPGGLVGLVLPSSFIAGPLYNLLRSYMREQGEILIVGSVLDRQNVFAEVDQDISVIIARAGVSHAPDANVVFGSFPGLKTFKADAATKLPKAPSDPWSLPAGTAGLAVGGATLADYGATVRSGYFVWNREQDRMVKSTRSKSTVPLIWAQNIKVGKFCMPKAKKRRGIDFVKFPTTKNSAIIRSNAIIIQRTTNNSQLRRLIAARISPSILRKWGGFITENHTIVITAPDIKTLDNLCILLNSAAVDARYRPLSGTASISVSLLRSLDLPSPDSLAVALSTINDGEKAVLKAYSISSQQLALSTAVA
ncbi:MAG: N-6 DNA methylase [Alphaproteobacteria bacterium]|nr:N-6 DNA methylase [Alphaproteobacteria bacterium]